MCFLHLWGYQINRSCDRFPAVLKISAYDGTSLIASSHPQPPLFPAEDKGRPTEFVGTIAGKGRNLHQESCRFRLAEVFADHR